MEEDAILNKIPEAQRNIWLIAAIPTAMAMLTASPLWAIPALCLAAILYYIVCEAAADGMACLLPRWLLWLEWGFLLLEVGKTANFIAGCWPKGNAMLFGLVLITLAGMAARQGAAAVGGAVHGLGWMIAGVMAIILVTVAVEGSEHQKVGSWISSFPVLSSAMLPLCALFLPGATLSGSKRLWSGIFLGTIFVLYCASGCASGGVGGIPLLYAIKGLELFGIFRRFEALASCLLTVGLFLILTLFFCSASEIAEKIDPNRWLSIIFYPGSVFIFFFAPSIPDAVVLYGSTIFWGILPVLTLLVVPPETREKSLEKSKKRC